LSVVPYQTEKTLPNEITIAIHPRNDIQPRNFTIRTIWYCRGNCAPNLLNDIENIHMKAARYIRRIKKRVHDREVLPVAHWISIIMISRKVVLMDAFFVF